MRAMLLAAGLGTRFQPHTNVRPKPLLPFLNHPLIYYPIRLAEQFSIDSFVINTHHLPEQMKVFFDVEKITDKKIFFADEQPSILGSGGGIKNAEKLLYFGDNFLVCNADAVIFPSKPSALKLMQEQHDLNKALATLFVMRHPDVGQKWGGVWVNSHEQVLGFGKSAPTNSSFGYHYVGLMLLNQKIFSYIPPGESNILHDVLSAAIRRGEKIQIYCDDCIWFETGNEVDFLAAQNGILTLPDYKNNYSWLYDLPTTQLDPNAKVVLGKSCHLESDVKLSGVVVLGDNCTVGLGCELENVVLESGVDVASQTKYKNQLILLNKSF